MTPQARLSALMLMLSCAVQAQLTEPLLEAYKIGLEDVPMEKLERGVGLLLKIWKWRTMPTPADVRRASGVAPPRALFLPETGLLAEWRPERHRTPEERGWPPSEAA